MDKILSLKKIIIETLDINKAKDIVSIDLKDKSSMADYMTVSYTHLTLPTMLPV